MKTFKLPLSIAAMILVAVSLAFAQETEDKDPFVNDPFFNDPIESIFENESDTTFRDYDHWRSLNSYGLDYYDFLEAGPYNAAPIYGLYPNLPMIHYNRVDGLYLGLSSERMQWYHDDDFLGIPNIQPHGMLAYSFGLNEWQYIIGFEKLIGREEHVMIGAEYHSATSTDDYWRVGLNETTLTAFTAGYDYLDYYKQEGWGAYLLVRSDRLWEGGIAFADDRYFSLNRNTGWTLLGTGGRFRPNPPVDRRFGLPVEPIHLASLTISAAFNPKRLLLTNNFSLSVETTVQLSNPNLFPTDYSFTKYLAEIVSLINFEEGGVFRYRFRAGSITGDVPLLEKFQLGGIGTLRAIPYKSLSPHGGGNVMLLSNAEVHFGAPDFDGWIDTDEFYIALFLDSGWVNYSFEQQTENNPLTGFSAFTLTDVRHNAGFGIGSNFIRFEVAWDLKHASRAPEFWIRFNPTF